MIICLNGKFLEEKKATISPLDNGFMFGDGFYDTMRAYKGIILELELHMKRIEKSAKKMGIQIPWEMKEIKKWIEKIAHHCPWEKARVRITLSRGIHGFDFLSSKHPTLVISAEEIIVDPKLYKKGATAMTMRLQRLMPEIKTLGLTGMIIAYRHILPKKVYEAIFINDHGYVREGASTNLFIIKKGVLMTAKNDILPGLTRARVLALSKKLKIKTIVADFKESELLKADEAFLSNRPREIIPIVKINGHKLSTGKVGPITQKVMAAYQEYIQEYMNSR